MQRHPARIVILTFPGVMQTAVHGLSEMFALANRVCRKAGIDHHFALTLLDIEGEAGFLNADPGFTVVLVPPSLDDTETSPVNPELVHWLRHQHAQGTLLCSVCAGAFLLAATGLLDHRQATTHWMLGERLQRQYPEIKLNTDRMLISDADIITAGGLMAWIDLGLELVARYAGPGVMRELGRLLVIDTGGREQRYYRRLLPGREHGDAQILKAQQVLQTRYAEGISVATLADMVHLTERTLLRRFIKATGVPPNQYLQRLRVDRACDLLEQTRDGFETIALAVGYQDASACRKAFVKLTGLTPAAYRRRFVFP